MKHRSPHPREPRRKSFLPSLALPRSILGLAVLLIPACGRPTVVPVPAPALADINSATAPVSPAGQLIEIHGSSFLPAPGQVMFTQAPANSAQVVPATGAWSDGRLLVAVPSGGTGGAFTVPGSVTVSVVTVGGKSNGISLSLVPIPPFTASSLAWATSTPLPAASRGHAAVAVNNTPTSAYVIVAGGNQLISAVSTNVPTVLTNTLNANGTVGATWTPTTALPTSCSYAAMVGADPTNSPVAVGAQFIYVLGGQTTATDAPGGTSTVYVASVNLSTGAVGSWSLTSALPIPLVAPSATVYNGYVYVLGGQHADGTSDGAVYSAQIHSDGTLAPWSGPPSTTAFPSAVSFSRVFGFGGMLYGLGGGSGPCTDPTSEILPPAPTSTCAFAPVQGGSVGAWTATSSLTTGREKHVHWMAFGQVLAGEGIPGTTGPSELESAAVQADGTLSSFGGLSGTQVPGANVYNAAAVLSPIVPVGGGPRFLLLGGQAVQTPLTGGGGALSATVWYNTAP
ncbi:MAG TPA: hypothetical protein VMU54_08730 [Planctomycetota bacterium]|nr:hypothetical protein [Planctomycetota bacterium]